mmetsp:Transcript_27504/g.58278  ORF Transcript_27504/g.58278 Transcript_27504/m.58278 type:complete len:106 (+) Transcript_27504:306-623(+)
MLGAIDDDEFVKQLLEEFDKEFWEGMEHIRNGLKTGELEQAKVAAHSMKGSAAVFGATQLSEAAKVLEYALKEGKTDVEELGKAADKIEKCFKEADREKIVEAMV